MDIIERLRDPLRRYDDDCYEAADEIERLREILRKIKWDIDQAQWPEELCMHWVDDVNAALQQKDSE